MRPGIYSAKARVVDIVRYGTVQINNGSGSGSWTLPIAVDPKRSRVRLLGSRNAGTDNFDSILGLVSLSSDGTTVNGTRSQTLGGLFLDVLVVQFMPGVVRSVQQVVVPMASGEASKSQALVTPLIGSRYEIDPQGATTDDNGTIGLQGVSGSLSISGANVVATRNTTSACALSLGGVVTEFF